MIEVLMPDFHAKEECLQMVAERAPHIFNHNIETVERLTPLVRSRAKYQAVTRKSCGAMKEIAPQLVTKSGIMLGLGETEPEIFQAMDDLRDVGVQVLTIGQYLRPVAAASAGRRVRPSRHVQVLRRDRGYRKGFRARRLRTASAKFVSRGRLSSRPAMSAEPLAIDRTNVAALIPAYFEAKRIAEVARRTRAQLDRVLVVDDGSTDGTEAAARDGGVEVVRHPINQGKGAAIKTGLRELSTRAVEYVLILDGDGQHLPEEIPAFLAEANRSHAPMILGSRMSDLAAMPFVRRMTNRFMSWQISRALRAADS